MAHLKVLVTEDSQSQLAIIQRYLQSSGMEVVQASRGEEVLDIVQREKPDAVVLDVMLPGISGFEVCRRLKGDAKTRNLPVVFLSALDKSRAADKARAAGADEYLWKEDFDLTELGEIIQKLVSRKDSQPKKGE
ncbi:MAG: response regulator [Planctomycetota bacterium]